MSITQIRINLILLPSNSINIVSKWNISQVTRLEAIMLSALLLLKIEICFSYKEEHSAF